MQSGSVGGIKAVVDAGGSSSDGAMTMRSRSSSPVSPVGDSVSDSAPTSVISTSASAPPSPPGDLQIRVLTPSEIMRTLPSMPQELAYEPSTQTMVSLTFKSAIRLYIACSLYCLPDVYYRYCDFFANSSV